MATSRVSPTGYTIIRTPTSSPRLLELASKFRETKLGALEAEPNGFAVKHAKEILHPLAIWQQRLAAPSTVLICVATTDAISDESDENQLLSGDWVGMATIRGPLPYTTFHLPESGQPIPDDPELETRWHLCNVYTSQAHRGKGIGRRLIDTGILFAQEQTRTLEGKKRLNARVRLFCNPEKAWIMNMYKGMGFEEAGKCTLREAFFANGDGQLVPADTSSTEKARQTWERRYGLAMERIIAV
ncbi:hypothetical protein CC78DRAFT_45258 [Lojkania enalia]|uniref:N-acetyltransferase domain-containing protein n=1 Tax=Lojkania enalia TaxID=147567 RepID=A0A9P4K0D2_9PLEO|nr:hypothetical protein CC78DRAFT_45258 [Didymosphaeria enalia]